LGNAEYPPESKGLEIREEEEQENLGLQATAQETSNIARQSLPEPDPGSIVHSKTEVLNGIEHLSLHAEASPSTEDDMGSTTTRPPSGIPDLASIDWSYLDPQGQVQGKLPEQIGIEITE
jgi:PERQ amino acid-rich with GYF domain-containing protein